MDQRPKPAPRLAPLPLAPEVSDLAQTFGKSLGFVPNSALIMQRKPKLLRAFSQLSAAVWDPESEVDRGFKRLVAHVASRAHGCHYWMAHTAGASLRLGIDEKKLAAVWENRTSPLYTEAERIALEFTVAATSQPNDVTDELFEKMKRHWTANQIVEIVGVIALFGFLNRFNDTMATPLEVEPTEVGEKHLARHGWTVGKHGRWAQPAKRRVDSHRGRQVRRTLTATGFEADGCLAPKSPLAR